MKKIAFSLFVCVMMILQSCSGKWNTVYSNQYNGKQYAIEVREVKGFTTNRMECRITYDNWKPLYINSSNTDWGVPYSTDIFGPNAFLVLDSSATYSNTPFRPGDNHITNTMIYIPSKNADDKYCGAYFDLLQEEWKNIQPILNEKYAGGDTRFIGIVEGDRDKFVQKFSGIIGGKSYLLVIENDGRVRWMMNDKSRNDEYSGLSLKVQMPGKKIYFQRRQNAIAPEQLKDYKNDYGTNPLHYFSFEEGEVHSADEPRLVIDEELKAQLCRDWKVAPDNTVLPSSFATNGILSLKADNTVAIINNLDTLKGNWDYDVNEKFIVIWGNQKIEKTYTLKSITTDTLILEYYSDSGDGTKAMVILNPQH